MQLIAVHSQILSVSKLTTNKTFLSLLSFSCSQSGSFLPTHSRYRGLLLHLITSNEHTFGRTPLDE